MIKDPLSNVTAPLFYVPKEFIADVANVSDSKSVRLLLEKHFPEAFKFMKCTFIEHPAYAKALIDKYYNQAFPKQKSNMKPFNLERALAGDPVITRDGNRVGKLFLFDSPVEKPLSGHVLGCFQIESWYKDGRHHPKVNEGHDLFMAPVKKKGWINIYPRNKFPDRQLGETIHETEESALSVRLIECGQTIKIEWEE